MWINKNSQRFLNVMLEPSLLIKPGYLERTISIIEKRNELRYYFRFYIPSTFLKVIKERDLQGINTIARFYRVRLSSYEIEHLPVIIRKMLKKEIGSSFSVSDISKNIIEKHMWLYKATSRAGPVLQNLLFEEWVFLQEMSFIVARRKALFEAFKKYGAVSIEMSHRAFEKVVRLTLKKDADEPLKKVDYLRSVGKWVAAGGGAITSLLDPVIGALIAVITNLFLLIDPP